MSELAVVTVERFEGMNITVKPERIPVLSTESGASSHMIAVADRYAMLPVSPGATVTAEKGWWCPAESALMFSTFCDHAGSREVTVVREVV